MTHARFFLSTSAMALAGCAAVAGIGDMELADPAPIAPPASPSTNAAPAPLPGEDASAPAHDASIDAPLEAAVDAADDAADDAPPVADPPDDVVGPAKCVLADFLANDRRDGAAERTVTFPVLAGYDPHCMMIRAGQSVTFRGDFTLHPLAPRGTSPAPNPVVLTSTGTSVTFAFPDRGRYRYGSPGSPSMRGAIDVRP